MAERNRRRRGNSTPLKIDFTFGQAKPEETEEPKTTEVPAEDSAIPVVADPVRTSGAIVPPGEVYSNIGGGLGAGTEKIRSSSGRMVVNRQAQRDNEARIKELLNNPGLKESTKASPEFEEIAKKLRKGAALKTSPTANESYDHLEQTHRTLSTYLDNLPQAIMDKADLHDATAKQIHAISPNHPEAIKQTQMANKLREFVGIPSGVNNVRDLRAARDSVLASGGALGKNLPYNLKVLNRLVEAKSSLNVLKTGGVRNKNGDVLFDTQSPTVNHKGIKDAHTELTGINSALNGMLSPLGMSSPVPTSHLLVWKHLIDNLSQRVPGKASTESYSEAHPETGEMSKPGHIWGEKPPVNVPSFDGTINVDYTTKYAPKFKKVKDPVTGGTTREKVGERIVRTSKDPREREQIPLTDEGKAYLEKTFGKNHDVVARWTAADNSLKESARKIKDAANPASSEGPLPDSAFDLNRDSNKEALTDRLVMGQYSAENARKRQAPKREVLFPNTSSAAQIAKQVRDAALMGADVQRAQIDDVAHHSKEAFNAMISGTKPPRETLNFINSHPMAEVIKRNVQKMADHHMKAVGYLKAGNPVPQRIAHALGTTGMQRAIAQAKAESTAGE